MGQLRGEVGEFCRFDGVWVTNRLQISCCLEQRLSIEYTVVTLLYGCMRFECLCVILYRKQKLLSTIYLKHCLYKLYIRIFFHHYA